ncbi:hypothetical protein BDV27DRAFT_165347 [Aspergillus caelatus]|uniref:Uncharacterized protein n=1 Tax=Aspergillus caelatus TaxID=61420 RepID=A0A5N7AIA8_9EURO|nr:uncharacterized protein BDV27DRAFT_165347 [Aspergillus caelatus]KAE8369485.1 hypothetical protein BDV27DRAFT_165347 [Aspergillus caelatus]
MLYYTVYRFVIFVSNNYPSSLTKTFHLKVPTQVQYSYAMVIQTIVTVESPQSSITDSLRTTIPHLRVHAGPFFWSALLPISDGSLWKENLRAILYIALLANIQVPWVHIIITKPSAKYLYQRLPGLKCWIHIVPVIVLEAIIHWLVEMYTLELATSLYNLTGFIDVEDLDLEGIQVSRRGYRLGAIGLVPCFITCMTTLPIRTVCLRIAASTLPDDDEPIVPLDPRMKPNLPSGTLNIWRDLPDRTWTRIWRYQAHACILSASIFFLGKMTYNDFHRFATIPMIRFNY